MVTNPPNVPPNALALATAKVLVVLAGLTKVPPL